MNAESLLNNQLYDELDSDQSKYGRKPKFEHKPQRSASKRRRVQTGTNTEDSLQIDLRLLAKLDSLCRYVINIHC